MGLQGRMIVSDMDLGKRDKKQPYYEARLRSFLCDYGGYHVPLKYLKQLIGVIRLVFSKDLCGTWR
jgi:hypothetical protein